MGARRASKAAASAERRRLIGIAIEVRGHGSGRLRLRVLPDRFRADHCSASPRRPPLTGAIVHTDGLQSYRVLSKHGYEHRRHPKQTAAPAISLLPRAHRATSNLKAWMHGTHRGVSDEHLQVYLDEYVFRHNRRSTPMAGVPDPPRTRRPAHNPTTYQPNHPTEPPKTPSGANRIRISRLLGSFLFARVWQAALARAALEPEQRPDASCYVDEVHNYLNLPTPFEDVLAQARSYRLSLCLAHQHLAQLPRDLREAIGANARSKVYFQVSRDDAQALEREVRPELSAHDLAHLPLYTAAVRLCNQGQPGRAFTLTTENLSTPTPEQAQAVRASARRRYGMTREQIEAQLAAGQRAPAIPIEAQRDVRARMAPADSSSNSPSNTSSNSSSN